MLEKNDFKIFLIENNSFTKKNFIEMLNEQDKKELVIKSVTEINSAAEQLISNDFDVILLAAEDTNNNALKELELILLNTNESPVILIIESNEDTGLKALEVGAEDYFILSEIGRRHIIRIIKNAMHRKKKYQSYTILQKEHIETIEALRESEARYRTISEYSLSAICIIDERGKIIWCNEKMIEMGGYSREVIYAQDSFITLLAPESVPFVVSNFQKAIAGEPYEHQYIFSYIRADGKIRECTKHMADYKDTNGKIKIIVNMSDITESKKAEEAVRESEEKYRTIFENAPVGIFRSTPDGKFLEVNYALAKMLGYDTPETVMEEIYDIGKQIYIRSEAREQIVKHQINDTGNTCHVNHYRRKDGTEFIANLYLKTIFDEKNNVKYLEGIVEDITERMQMQLELEKLISQLEISLQREQSAKKELVEALRAANEAVRLKTEFLAMMSHEIRTPLSGIIGFSGLLTTCEDIEDAKENADFIYQSANRLNELLTNILELSAIQAGKEFSVIYSEFNIEGLIESILILLSSRIKKQNNNIILNIDCEKIIFSDQLRLQQILFNLIANAVKFTENGEIVITADKRDDNYIFTVKDNGIGIDNAKIEEIFDLFIQLDHSMNTRKFQGTGIGLTVCKRLVEILKGDIRVDSESGKGSTFFVSLPIQNASLKSIESETVKIGQNTLKDLKILYAEDDMVHFVYLKKIIESLQPARYKGFNNGLELLEEFQQDNDYNLILLDIQMPVMNGVECLKSLRECDKKIPIFAFTAFSMKEDKEKFLSFGFNEYIGKPFNKNELISKIQNHVLMNDK